MINNCFMASTQFNLRYPAPTSKNWRILLEQNFAACMPLPMAAAWHSCNVIGRIDEVTLCRARLVEGWVTVFGGQTTSVFSPSHPGQLSLLPSAGREMSTSQSAVMLCCWGVKAGMVHCFILFVDKRVGCR